MKNVWAAGLAAGAALLLIFAQIPALHAQEVPPAKPALGQGQSGGEIIPGPKDARERTAVYVFLDWLWVLIIVLVFILRAKIKEVDALHNMRFFQDEDKSSGA